MHLLDNFFTSESGQDAKNFFGDKLESYLDKFDEPIFFHFDEIGEFVARDPLNNWTLLDSVVSRIAIEYSFFQIYLSGVVANFISVADIRPRSGGSRLYYTRLN